MMDATEQQTSDVGTHLAVIEDICECSSTERCIIENGAVGGFDDNHRMKQCPKCNGKPPINPASDLHPENDSKLTIKPNPSEPGGVEIVGTALTTHPVKSDPPSAYEKPSTSFSKDSNAAAETILLNMESNCSSLSASSYSDKQPNIKDNEQGPPSKRVCKQQASMMSEDVPQGMVQSIGNGNVQISIGNRVEQGTNRNRQLENMPATNILTVQLGGNKDVETCQNMNISRNRTDVNGPQYNMSGPVTFHQTSEQPSIRDVSDSEVAEAGVPPVAYNHMVFEVFSELSEKQFKHMKRLVRSDETSKLGIPKDLISSVKDAEELMELMEKFKYLGSTNTWFLQYLLYFVGNKSLYKKVFMFTKKSLTSSNALYVHEPSKIKGPNQSNVKLKIVGDINQFRPIDVEAFRRMLAKQCGENIMYVCANGLQEGSIILYYQVPEGCKKHLLASHELPNWCLEYGITQICVDEEDMVLLQLPQEVCYNYATQSDAILDVLRNCTDRDYVSAIHKELKIGGKPLLHLAVELNYIDLVQCLISSGANVANTDQMKATALHLAVFLGHTEICKELLNHDATKVNAVDQFGNTALHLAAYQDDFKLGTMLIDHGASTDVTNQEAQSPIFIAETNNCVPLILCMTDKKVEDLAVTVDKYIFTCPVCYSLFKKPRVLPCSHNFCENCLKKQWQTKGKLNHIECSLCKKVCTVPDGDITGFMLNKPLLEQVEEAKHILKLEKQKAEQAKQVSDDKFIGGVETLKILSEESTTKKLVATSQPKLREMETTSDTAALMECSISENIENTLQITAPPLMMVTEKSLTCPICQKRFRKPVRKLNCSHSFCETCLKARITPGKRHIACHVCNEETDFTEGEDIGLLDLHLNYLVGDADISRPHDLDQTDLSDEGEDWSDCECDPSSDLVYEKNKSEQMDATTEETGETSAATMGGPNNQYGPGMSTQMPPLSPVPNPRKKPKPPHPKQQPMQSPPFYGVNISQKGPMGPSGPGNFSPQGNQFIGPQGSFPLNSGKQNAPYGQLPMMRPQHGFNSQYPPNQGGPSFTNNMVGGLPPPPVKQQIQPQQNPAHYQQQYGPSMKRPYPGHPGPQNFPVQGGPNNQYEPGMSTQMPPLSPVPNPRKKPKPPHPKQQPMQSPPNYGVNISQKGPMGPSGPGNFSPQGNQFIGPQGSFPLNSGKQNAPYGQLPMMRPQHGFNNQYSPNQGGPSFMNNMMGGFPIPPVKQAMYAQQIQPQQYPAHHQQQYGPGTKIPYPSHPGLQHFPVQAPTNNPLTNNPNPTNIPTPVSLPPVSSSSSPRTWGMFPNSGPGGSGGGGVGGGGQNTPSELDMLGLTMELLDQNITRSPSQSASFTTNPTSQPDSASTSGGQQEQYKSYVENSSREEAKRRFQDFCNISGAQDDPYANTRVTNLFRYQLLGSNQKDGGPQGASKPNMPHANAGSLRQQQQRQMGAHKQQPNPSSSQGQYPRQPGLDY